MLSRTLKSAVPRHTSSICLFCSARAYSPVSQTRSFATAQSLRQRRNERRDDFTKLTIPGATELEETSETLVEDGSNDGSVDKPWETSAGQSEETANDKGHGRSKQNPRGKKKEDSLIRKVAPKKEKKTTAKNEKSAEPKAKDESESPTKGMSLKEALLGSGKKKKKAKAAETPLPIKVMYPENFEFKPVEHEIPPVPMLSYGLDRVLFNPGVYRLQDPRTRIFNFDPYLEKIMPVHEFDFNALSEYKTSSKDEELLNLTQKIGSKFTGSTSSMSGVLQHFHYALSNFRGLNHDMLSREFPDPSNKFSKITLGPSAIFLRYKDGIHAIDADKTYDRPNIMSWLGHSLEKLLTTERSEFERYRKSSPVKAPAEDDSSRCYHYSQLGNFLMRSQLDAYDPRLPGSGVFDLKTRAVVSIRMNHQEYEEGTGYQLRKARGEWESFEREFYDMTRATLLKYSLQVRMGRMDGIFVAFHNIERIFGFQYLTLSDMDLVLHGQHDTCLGDREFRLSLGLLDEILTRATTHFPNTSLRLHFESRQGKAPFMYIFAEPVTEEQADEIQSAGKEEQEHFMRTVVGIGKDNPEVQAAWQDLQEQVNEQVDEDQVGDSAARTQEVETNQTSDPQTNDQDASIEQNETDANSALKDEIPEGPLMGWTLTVRSMFNGDYVERVQNMSSEDEWKIEYHLSEIPEKTRRSLYKALRTRRANLMTQDDETNTSLKHYRNLIQRYNERGRKWRTEQDALEEEQGVKQYRPLGPGSEAEAEAETET